MLVAIHDGRVWRDAIGTVDDPWFGLACDRTGATLTDVEEQTATEVPGGHRGVYTITRLRCTATGCRREQGTVEVTRWRSASRYLAASIDDALALIWRSGAGDVRITAAPPGSLPRAPTRSAFEGGAHGGYDFDEHGAELLVVEDRGLLLVAHEVAGDVATHGFIVDPDGTLRPIVVSP